MRGEAKKLHLIEEILKIENEALLDEVETIIIKRIQQEVANTGSFSEFAGKMSDDEVMELESIIDKGCEQINPDDWK